ncbi:MAG: zinc ABC transporter substrate-binding protein [Rhodospirillales bacterium]|nr:zinc ABC transporter substrate-binding protein [Rhodospirillales bacterium]
MDRPRIVSRRFPVALAAVALLGLGAAGPATAEDELRVVASIKPVHSLVSAVMAGVGEPHLIIRGHSSPHTFTMRPSDAEALEGADIVFMVGDTMETALAGPVDALAGHARVVKLVDTPGLVLRTVREGGAFEEHDHASHGHGGMDDHADHDDHGHADHDDHADDHDDHGAFDLHVWLDPINGWTMARAIGGALSDVDPANAATYEANVDALLHRLNDLTGEIAQEVTPARGVPFIVFHDGYRYFEDRFGLTAAGSVVISPERAPGARRISELRERLHSLGVVCVFDEPQFDKRLVHTVIEGIDVKSGTVDPIGATIDNGPELYFTLLRNMASSFRDCLSPDDGA